MSRIFIALGSNIEPEKNMQLAMELLKQHFSSARFSSVYKTAAREVEEQNDFLNAVAEIQSDASPHDVQKVLKSIENELEKAPPYRFGPRTIDLDILLYDDTIVESDDLTIPHPRMHERRFVLEPLCELIDVQEAHPVFGDTFGWLLGEVSEQECVKEEDRG